MSLYADLGVEPDADRDTISRAHRGAAKKHHPDHGGDRDEFERVQRAWLVLRDPAKRERYDKTGETGDRPNNPMADFAEIIVPAFDQALSEAAERMDQVDVMAAAKAKLRQSISDITVEVGKTKALGKRFEKALKRLKFTGDGPDFIGNVLRDRVEQIARSASMMEQQRTKIEAALEMADIYGWDTAKPPQQQSFSNAMWMMS